MRHGFLTGGIRFLSFSYRNFRVYIRRALSRSSSCEHGGGREGGREGGMVRCGLQQCASLLRSSVASSSNFSLLLLLCFVKPLARALEPRGQVRAGGAERASTVRDAALTATTGTSAPLLSRALEAMQGRTHCGPMVSGSRGERGGGSSRRTSSARSEPPLPKSASMALRQPAGIRSEVA